MGCGELARLAGILAVPAGTAQAEGETMRIQIDLSPLGPILLEVDEARELHRQLGVIFDAVPNWKRWSLPDLSRGWCPQATAGMSQPEMRRLAGAVGE